MTERANDWSIVINGTGDVEQARTLATGLLIRLRGEGHTITHTRFADARRNEDLESPEQATS